MRILTVRQPWAWAIIHGGKDVENRVRNIAGDYRGPVAIHAGLTHDDSAPEHLWVDRATFTCTEQGLTFPDTRVRFSDHGVIIGVVDLVDVHDSRECWRKPWKYEVEGWCSSWAQEDAHHLVLANPRPLADPIPFKGALGLRTLDDDTTARILAQIGAAA